MTNGLTAEKLQTKKLVKQTFSLNTDAKRVAGFVEVRYKRPPALKENRSFSQRKTAFSNHVSRSVEGTHEGALHDDRNGNEKVISKQIHVIVMTSRLLQVFFFNTTVVWQSLKNETDMSHA